MKNIQISFEKKIAIFFTLVLLAIVCIILIYRKISQQSEANRKRVTHTENILALCDSTLLNEQNIVIGTRTFIITGNEFYLQSYKQNHLFFNNNLQKIKALAIVNSVREKLDSIQGLYAEYSALRSEAIALRRSQNFQLVTTIPYIHLLDRKLTGIRSLFNTVKEEERKLLVQRRAKYLADMQRAVQLIRVLLLVFIISILSSFVIVYKNTVRRNKAEKALHHSNELVRSIIDHAPVLVNVKDLAGNYINVNKQFAHVFGKIPNELIGKTNDVFLDAQTAGRIKKEEAEVLRSGQSLEMQIKLPQVDGMHSYVTSKFPLFDEKGKIYAIGSTSADITPIVNAHEALEKSFEQQQKLFNGLQHVLSASSDIICIINEDGEFVMLTDTVEDLLGYKPKELMYKKFINYVLEEDREKTEAIAANTMLGKPVSDFTNRYLKKDGSIIPIIWTATWEPGDKLLYCIARNGTERQKTAEQLVQSQSSLMHAQKIARLGNWEWDVKNDKISCSEEMYHLLGRQKDEVESLKDVFYNAVHPDDRKLLQKAQKESIFFGKKIEVEHRVVKPDGTICFMQTRGEVLLDEAGKPFWISGTMQDITDAKKAEEEIANSEERRRLIMNAAHDAIICVDIKGNIIFWNPQAQRTFQWTEEEVINKPVTTTIVPEPYRHLYEDGLQHYLTTGKANALNTLLELNAVNKEGKEFPVELTILPIKQGNEQFFCAFIRDISERKQAEKLIKEANLNLEKRAEELQTSNAELERFAYVASHDLQEPVRMVSSFLGLLKKRLDGTLDDQSKQYIHFAVDGAERMKRLIQDLLLFSRLGTDTEKMAPVDLNDVIKNVLQTYALSIAENSAQIKTGTLPIVTGCKVQLNQVFQNLVGNALKYRSDVPPQIEISCLENKEEWIFSVKDNGIGIDPKFYEKIFIIFQRLHNKSEYGGTGIGLAICKKIIERHGGRIWVESTPGYGSSFFFTLKKHHHA